MNKRMLLMGVAAGAITFSCVVALANIGIGLPGNVVTIMFFVFLGVIAWLDSK